MKRRQFLRALGAGAAAAGGSLFGLRPGPVRADGQTPASPTKHWAWMRGETRPLDAWKRKLASMKASGIDAVLISGSPDFYREAVPAAADEGLELHAWLFTMMRGGNTDTHPEWYAVSRSGKSTATEPPYVDYYRFMCPSREPVREHLAGLVGELSEIPNLGSVHLDYIRYPDVILPVALWPRYNLIQDREYPDFDFCYCAVCRDRFRQQSGVDPAELDDPAEHQAWVQYRYDTITEVVAGLAEVVHANGTLMTAAVFPTPAIARRLVRQDWTRWPLDAVLPMVYNGFYNEDVAWIEAATREGVSTLRGRIPLYSGLYVPDLPPADLARAVERALAGGANGVSFFEGNTLTPEHWQAVTPLLQKRGSGR